MKKIKIFFVTACAVTSIFISCQKEDIEIVPTTENESQLMPDLSEPSHEPTHEDQSRATASKKFYDLRDTHGPDAIGCYPITPYSCSNIVVVTPASVADFEEIFDAVENGTQQDIDDAFTDHFNLLNNEIPQAWLNGVLQGTYDPVVAGGFDSGEVTYLQFEDNGTTVHVQPYEAP